MKKKLIFCLLLLPLTGSLQARGTYQLPAAFLNDTFNNEVPAAKLIWLTGDIRKTAMEILQHEPDRLRLRYWKKNYRSAWILEEIGKEKLITAGIVINKNKIEQVKVLIFREGRGDEIRHDFFTKQFKQATLKTDTQLTQNIDGISGATMSVRALTKLARLALFLSAKVESL